MPALDHILLFHLLDVLLYLERFCDAALELDDVELPEPEFQQEARAGVIYIVGNEDEEHGPSDVWLKSLRSQVPPWHRHLPMRLSTQLANQEQNPERVLIKL